MICPNGHGLKGGNYCGRCGAHLVEEEEPGTLHCPWCRVKVTTAPHWDWDKINGRWFIDSFCLLCGRRFLDADGHLVVVPWWAQILARLGDLIWATACSP